MSASKVTRSDIEREIRDTLGLVPGFFKGISDEALEHEWPLFKIQLTLHSFELATLIAAARWISDGCVGELPAAAIEQLQQVVKHYDSAWQQQQPSSLSSAVPMKSA